MKDFYKLFHSISLILLKMWVWIAIHVYFRRIKVTGKENIPKDKPIIFAPNHQYAFMDALLIVVITKKIMALNVQI